MSTYTKEELAVLWLDQFTELEYKYKRAILEQATAKELLENFEKIAAPLIQRSKTRVYESMLFARSQPERAAEFLETRGIFAVTLYSEDYPEAFLHLPCPPLVCYCRGRRELLASRKFCIVGSRRTSPAAMKQAESFSRSLSEHFTIVTGLAEGGDEAAVRGALPSGNLISVLPCGFDHVYPAAHRSLSERIAREGLLLSEYHPSIKTEKYHFHRRNQLLATLAEGILAVSAGKVSGVLLTAEEGLIQGKNVYAFPYGIGVSSGEGCNALIKKGAFLADDILDIFTDYGINLCKKEGGETYSKEERAVLSYLAEVGEAHVEQIAERTAILAYLLPATLSALEIKGKIARMGSNRYRVL